ncbi:MAG: hypothetical protein WC477_03810 [Patescibacteria group bacterium]
MENNDKQEILEAIQAFAEQVDHRLNNLESDVGTMKSDMGTMKSDMGTMKSEMGSMKFEITSIKSQMVTKDYLDDKLADLKSELIILTRKENTKLSVLVEELVVSKTLTRKTADRILLMEPFAQERAR